MLPDLNSPAVRNRFKWRTLEGNIVTLDTITNTHAVNIIKMLWNEVVDIADLDLPKVTRPVDGRCNRASPYIKVLWIFLLIREIENRGGSRILGEHYAEPYEKIKNECFILGKKIKLLVED